MYNLSDITAEKMGEGTGIWTCDIFQVALGVFYEQLGNGWHPSCSAVQTTRLECGEESLARVSFDKLSRSPFFY